MEKVNQERILMTEKWVTIKNTKKEIKENNVHVVFFFLSVSFLNSTSAVISSHS